MSGNHVNVVWLADFKKRASRVETDVEIISLAQEAADHGYNRAHATFYICKLSGVIK